MAIQVSKQIIVSEDGFNVVVPEHMWDFATLLQSIAIPDRKVSQINLFRMAHPEMSLRECKMIIEAVTLNFAE